ncbi:MAG TPA: folylpolyglutamate synthase/dihydrofolate synthase family protein [Dissulfurispiraceae bacterium]|nr:folylpolyglutamate synthase/dihydrofolate synthase family protein [Dissulfurispiraceae bacterium]
MHYPEAIGYLLSLQTLGVKLGLEKMRAVLDLLGNPERSFRSIHIAGTNGKGSVAAISASLLQDAGHRAGLYTSPHLVSFTERIRVGNDQIREDDVIALTTEIRDILALHPEVPSPTFFEFVTAMAFLHFARSGVEWAVIETGMGGRLDATNVVRPAVSVITSIGLDHREHLGNSLSEIAKEKAGIIKSGVPVISASQPAEAGHVVGAYAESVGAAVSFYGRDFGAVVRSCTLEETIFDYGCSARSLPFCSIPLAGRHQAENAAVALRAADTALAGLQLTDEMLKEGLKKASWKGRLEVVGRDPLTIVDGAHNPAAARALAAFLREGFADHEITFVLGMLADKDVERTIHPLLEMASHVVVTAPHSSRAATPENLAAVVRRFGIEPERRGNVADAVAYAQVLANERTGAGGKRMVVATGSLYVVGETLTACGMQPVLAGVREWR